PATPMPQTPMRCPPHSLRPCANRQSYLYDNDRGPANLLPRPRDYPCDTRLPPKAFAPPLCDTIVQSSVPAPPAYIPPFAQHTHSQKKSDAGEAVTDSLDFPAEAARWHAPFQPCA